MALNYSRAYETSVWLEKGSVCGSLSRLQTSTPWPLIKGHKPADNGTQRGRLKSISNPPLHKAFLQISQGKRRR